ncbi:MAG TPA: 5'-3' exonuclease H3TH domain-containing protein [Candidatus Limnocylindria bacterium]|nr:5'-3' exonuclease H3TH domain-containing protein [Candidatus Limnocylindria bacterium]
MLLLVDFSSLLYRAFFSMSADVPAHAVHGFLNMLARVIADRKPARLAIAVDEDWRPAFRVAAIPAYKAQRVAEDGEEDEVAPQDAIGRHVLRAMGIAVVGALGYEADDVIATLAAREPGPVEILSGDRDLFALVRDPDVRVLYPARGVRELEVIDEAAITRRYGIPGRAYGDFALLRGDPSDGLPGVRGIGEKTASRLLAEHGSLDALLAAPALPAAVAAKLAAAAEYLAAARRVVLPVADLALEPLDLTLPADAGDGELLAALADEWKLAAAVDRVQRAIAAARS